MRIRLNTGGGSVLYLLYIASGKPVLSPSIDWCNEYTKSAAKRLADQLQSDWPNLGNWEACENHETNQAN